MSDKNRAQNIATEINAGKPAKQAEAIGYAVQRRNEGKKDGGEKRPGDNGHSNPASHTWRD